MREHQIILPVLGLIAITRAMIGFGAGLLVSKHLGARHRRVIGLGLIASGLASTIPLALSLFRGRKRPVTEVRAHYYEPPRGYDGDVATMIAD